MHQLGLGDEGAAAFHPHQKPFPGQQVQSLAHRGAADVQHPGQLVLRGYPGPGGVLPAGDLPPDPLRYLHISRLHGSPFPLCPPQVSPRPAADGFCRAFALNAEH